MKEQELLHQHAKLLHKTHKVIYSTALPPHFPALVTRTARVCPVRCVKPKNTIYFFVKLNYCDRQNLMQKTQLETSVEALK